MKWISSIISVCIIIFSAWLFIDNRFFTCDAAQELDQLRVSRSLLENEIRRNPADRLLRRDLEIINGQIRVLEDRLRQ